MAILSSLCFFSKPPLSLVLLGMTFMLTTISFSKLLWRRILFQFFLIVMGYVGVQLIFQIVFCAAPTKESSRMFVPKSDDVLQMGHQQYPRVLVEPGREM